MKQAQISPIKSKVALTEMLERRFGGDPEGFIGSINGELNRLLRVDLKKARQYLDNARRCGRWLPSRFRPRFLAMAGRLALWSGDNRQALKHYRSALELSQDARDFLAAARLRKGMVEVYMYLGQYAAGIKAGQAALRYFRRRGLDMEAAQTLTNIGNVYHRMDRNRSALRYYEKARSLLPDPDGVAAAVVDYNRANIYANLNELKQAEALYRDAAAVYHRSQMELAENQAYYSIAYLNYLADHYTEALTAFERVYDSFSELGDVKSAAITQLDMMEINVHLNQYGSAIMASDVIVPRFRKLGMCYEEGKALYFGAVARMELEDYHRAGQQLKLAERLFDGEGNRLWLGMVALARGNLMMRRGRARQAAAILKTAEGLFEQSHDLRRRLDASLARLESLRVSGQERPSETLAKRLDMANLAGYQRYRFHSIEGDYLFARDDFVNALKHYEAAVKMVEKMLSGLFTDEIRYFFAVDKYESYARMVECLLKLGRTRESFVHNLKALSLVNKRVISESRLRSEVPPQVISNIRRLRTSLKKQYRFPKEGERGFAEALPYESVEQRLWQQERKARTFLYPSAAGAVADPAPSGGLSRYMAADASVVNYFSRGNSLGAFVAGAGKVEYVPLDINLDDLGLVIRKLHFLAERSVADRRLAESVGEIEDHYLTVLNGALIEPLQDRLKQDRLIIIANESLAQVPFAALRNPGGECLKDLFDLRLVINPEDIVRSRGSRVDFRSGSNAVFGVSSAALPLVDLESRAIGQSFPQSRLYLGADAICAELSRELATADGFVHVAAHASRSSENPLFSRILLNDGPFFPFDLFGVGVKAQLVTLSGCQTAAPGLYYGNSFSLARAFYQAGADNVLASLWPVSDEATTAFMTEFYRYLEDTDDVFASYRGAVKKLQTLTSVAALWGAFVLLGM